MTAALLAAWRHSRATARHPDAGSPPGAPAGPATEELDAQAARALVETDDSVRTSGQELGFATARFGEQAAAPFSAALRSATAELAEAFRLRQLLDDGVPAGETARRSRLAEVSARCAEASRLLDEQSEAFDRLVDPGARAPQLAAEVDAHVAQQAARVERSRQILARLVARYTPQAVAAVAASPGQAADRLDFANACLLAAHQEPDGETDVTAALLRAAQPQPQPRAALLQAAEAAADQAADLLSAVQHAEAELTQAASALPAALRELDTEIAEANALVADQPPGERASIVTRALAIAAGVREQQAAGPFDALAALAALQQADTALDHILAGGRDEQTRRERARAVLDQAMLVARSSVTAAEDFIATRRGGVGASARTRLAEARRHFQLAIGAAQAGPEAAVAEAQHTDTLARQASSLAEQDVATFDTGTDSAAREPGLVADGGTSADGGESGDGLESADGLRAALLGGILIDRRLGPGSFGGSRTRGRRGAGGWFAPGHARHQGETWQSTASAVGSGS
jgi:hypothetical protein